CASIRRGAAGGFRALDSW
nr:immunoglobulin heavy chain junction region [Macaca mulatta]MOX97029.1 immunoglobulin heavy chain junction region [Macaca mulatta]